MQIRLGGGGVLTVAARQELVELDGHAVGKRSEGAGLDCGGKVFGRGVKRSEQAGELVIIDEGGAAGARKLAGAGGEGVVVLGVREGREQQNGESERSN
jgi:hypothetical protein